MVLAEEVSVHDQTCLAIRDGTRTEYVQYIHAAAWHLEIMFSESLVGPSRLSPDVELDAVMTKVNTADVLF